MNNLPLTLTILGSGSSSGCPVIACDCDVCCSNNPKNVRTRCSAWFNIDNTHLIIDTGTDFRHQALREKIPQVNAVLYTHPHSDHVNGIDDLRAFCFRQKSPIDIYGNEFTIKNLQSRFDYAFLEPNHHWNRPVLIPHILDLEQSSTQINNIPIQYWQMPHGKWHVLSYRIGNIAWLTDVSEVSDEIIATYLQNLDYLFIDCLMDKAYRNHLCVSQVLEIAPKINAKNTYLIHTTHHLGFDETNIRLKQHNIRMAYDSMRINAEITI